MFPQIKDATLLTQKPCVQIIWSHVKCILMLCYAPLTFWHYSPNRRQFKVRLFGPPWPVSRLTRVTVFTSMKRLTFAWPVHETRLALKNTKYPTGSDPDVDIREQINKQPQQGFLALIPQRSALQRIAMQYLFIFFKVSPRGLWAERNTSLKMKRGYVKKQHSLNQDI